MKEFDNTDKMREIDDLVEFLNNCNRRYYVECDPMISDYEFDQKLKHLQALESETGYVLPYSPTQRVGSDLQSGFSEVDRTRIMGSIENSYDLDELRSWIGSTDNGGHGWIIEPKYDGLSLSVIYIDGVYSMASTRGTGYRGTDVTLNARTISTIPLKLNGMMCGDRIPHIIEVRGEVLMPKSELASLNDERVSQGLAPFANERNAAAGSLKQLDPAVTAARNLIFRPYAVYCDSDEIFRSTYLSSQIGMLKAAYAMGFAAPEYWVASNADEVIDAVRSFEISFLKTKDFCMDGCVVKVNSFERQTELGYTQKVPRWAKAFKFKQESASTLLNDVIWQVSREGKLSPVAVLDPIEVDGTVIRNAYLNNMDYIRANGIKIGGKVFIERGGGVIPKVTGIDIDGSAESDLRDIAEPSVCPCCGHPVSRKIEDGTAVYCTNPDCDDRAKAMVYYFGTKNCMNIKYLGEEVVNMLFDAGMVRVWWDLYRLSESDIALAGVGQKNAEKIYAEIQASKRNSADVVLASLGIPMCGKVTARKIMEIYGTIGDFFSAVSKDGIGQIDGVGEVACKAISEYVMSNPMVFDAVADYLDPAPVQHTLAVGGALSGKTLLATGSFTCFTREGISESVKLNGGKYASGVSRKLDYLIVGSDPGASKVNKAKELGIAMISEDEYVNLIR